MALCPFRNYFNVPLLVSSHKISNLLNPVLAHLPTLSGSANSTNSEWQVHWSSIRMTSYILKQFHYPSVLLDTILFGYIFYILHCLRRILSVALAARIWSNARSSALTETLQFWKTVRQVPERMWSNPLCHPLRLQSASSSSKILRPRSKEQNVDDVNNGKLKQTLTGAFFFTALEINFIKKP